MNIYLDESGNTGDNLLDSQQEFFSISAIAIHKEIQDNAFDFINSIMVKTNMKEIKTKDIIGTKYEPLLIPVHKHLIDTSCLLFTVLLEKRYMIAANIVDNFFDPVYNSRTNDSWTYPSNVKIKYANIYYERLTEGTINAVEQAFKSGSELLLTDAYTMIYEEINTIDECSDLVWFFQGAKSKINALSIALNQSEKSLGHQKQHRVHRSPNYTTFWALINAIELHLREFHLTAPIYFDSARQFDAPFKDIFFRMSQAKKTDLDLGNKNIVFGYEAIEDFIPVKHNLLGLQLSDLIATSAYKVFKKLKHRKDETVFTEYEKYIIRSILSQIKANTFHGVLSNNIWSKYYSCFKSTHKNYHH